MVVSEERALLVRYKVLYKVRYRDKCFDTQEKSVPHNKVQKIHKKVKKTHIKR